jgi:hypothetical protein
MYRNVQNSETHDDLPRPRARKGTTEPASGVNFIPTAAVSPKPAKIDSDTTTMPCKLIKAGQNYWTCNWIYSNGIVFT